MNGRAERLHALLETVRSNRRRPRSGSGDRAGAGNGRTVASDDDAMTTAQDVSLMSEPATSAAAASVTEVPPPPGPAPSMPVTEPRTAPMPRLDVAAEPAAARRPEPVSPLKAAFDHTLSRTEPPAPLAVPQRSAAPVGEEVPLPSPAQTTKPVAQAVSPRPSVEEATFGELLHRSLALRPL